MPNPRTVRKTPLFALASISADELALVGDADVEVTVGGQDHAVRPVLDEVLDGHVVGELDAGAAVGRPAGPQLLERREDLGLLQARRGRQHQPRRPGVDDDRHAVVLAELLDHRLQRRLAPAGACWAVCIEPETSIRKTRLLGGRPRGRSACRDQADPRQPVLGFHGQPATSTCTANGSSPVGGGSS